MLVIAEIPWHPCSLNSKATFATRTLAARRRPGAGGRFAGRRVTIDSGGWCGACIEGLVVLVVAVVVVVAPASGGRSAEHGASCAGHGLMVRVVVAWPTNQARQGPLCCLITTVVLWANFGCQRYHANTVTSSTSPRAARNGG